MRTHITSWRHTHTVWTHTQTHTYIDRQTDLYTQTLLKGNAKKHELTHICSRTTHMHRLGYRVVVPSDGSGQVLLVPPGEKVEGEEEGAAGE